MHYRPGDGEDEPVCLYHYSLAEWFTQPKVKKTSAPIGAWKCNFHVFLENYAIDRKTNQPTNTRRIYGFIRRS